MSSTPPPRFGVIVPVKPPAVAKSRLAPLGDAVRRDLVVAFAVDTVTAVLEAPVVGEVLVVTDDHLLARGLADLGVRVLPDGATDDLNGSLVQAAAELHRRRPDLSPVALCADLPALRTEELTRALAEAGRHDVAFVADAQGVGTTLVTARHLDGFAPASGPAHAPRTSTPARTRSPRSTSRRCGATWTPRPTSTRRSRSASARAPGS